MPPSVPENDQQAAERKKDHIELALRSRVSKEALDGRFHYEPLFSAHPRQEEPKPFSFLGKTFKVPIWVSSMTGGTAMAATINRNLARACGEFGMGMGLGSCRQLLFADTHLKDFQVRKLLGDQPLYANLGIAQLESLLEEQKLHLVDDLIAKLEADGLIIHVNPMQEWLQPEGDRFSAPPLDTIKRVLDKASYKIIVKEVGQGMGPASLRALMQLPIEALDFGASGGTNFALLELLRSDATREKIYGGLARVGHSADEMVDIVNHIVSETGTALPCKQIIISGGVADFLDGYWLTSRLKLPSVYGQAAGLLEYARKDYESLQAFLNMQIDGLAVAKAYLQVK
jgi:isopentenyl-diphosphate delta-isomerase